MKRKDALEDFIWNNKEGLDSHNSPSDLWSKIENELGDEPPQKDQKPSFGLRLWIVLGIIALLATAYIFYNLGSQHSESKAMLFAEVESMEHHYDRQARHMIKTVGYTNDILQIPDLEDINIHITEIKEELGELPQGSEGKALQALLESYKTKLMIIERILTDYEISQSKNNTREFDI